MLFLNEDLYSFEYDAGLDCWILIWNEFMFSDEYRESNLEVLEKLKGQTMRKLIRDTSKLNIIAVKDQQWFLENIVPGLMAAGLQYAAVVLPKEQLTKMAVQDIAGRVTPKGVETRLFATLDEAKAWMKTV